MKLINLSSLTLILFLVSQHSYGQCSVKSVTDGRACMGASGSVSAKGDPGNIIRWYDQPTGGNLLDTGDTLTIPVVNSAGTYWAEVFDGGVLVNDSLNTTAPNNGQAGATFDVMPLTDLTVTGINFVPRSSTTYLVSVYYKSGTHQGFESNSNAWTLLGTSSSFSATANNVTRVPLTFSAQLTANQKYAFYIYATGVTTSASLGYTNGTTLGSLHSSNSDLEIYQGRGTGGLFSTSLFTVRTFSGTLLYSKGGSCISTREPVNMTVIDNTKITENSPYDSTCINLPSDLFVKADGEIQNYKWQIYDNGSGMYNDINTLPFILNGDTLLVSNTPDTLNGAIIRCIAEGTCGADTSKDMTIIVSPLPKVITPPEDLTLDHGSSAVFRVIASGVNLKYRWQAGVNGNFAFINNNGIYSGVYTDELRVKGISRAQDNTEFRCVVMGAGSCAAEGDTSLPALLNVNPPASVSSINSEYYFSVYPNPVSGEKLFIDAPKSTDNYQYTIINKLGQIVATGTITSGDESINVAQLSKDIYFLKIHSADANEPAQTIRFVKL